MKRKLLNGLILTALLFVPFSVNALEKKETVYVNLNSDGSNIKTTVNNHIYNNENSKIDDETELKNIININGKEKYTLNDNKLVWKAKGKDIFYQGTTDKQTPITIKATYYLNGNETKVEDMIGKKGKVRIELELTNNVYIYQNNSKLYTPFVTTVATMISDKNNSNFTISNGKAVDTGSKNILVGIAAPGLYESTNISEFSDLDNITISYDTTKFSLNEIYIVATPKLLEDLDFDVLSKVDTLSSSMNLIQDNMNKIDDGAKQLKEGSSKLSNGASQIATNLKTVANGLEALEKGSQTLDSGVGEMITRLNGVQAMLQDSNIEGSIANLRVLASKNSQTITAMTQNPALNAIYEQYKQTDRSQAARDAILASVPAEVQQNVNILFLIDANNIALNQTITSLEELNGQITNLITQLTSGLTKIKDGTSQISTNVTTIKVGVNKLYNGSLSLQEGSTNLENGIDTLSNGISTLNNEGINKLTDLTKKAQSYTSKIKELEKLSKDYNGFTSNNSQSTIFIYKLASK